jgi:hypothetical protein
MALQLNLLHEEITEERQRKRDPLKLGMMALGAVGAIMLLFYMLKAYQTLAFKSRLSAVEQDWAKVEPTVTAAQKRAEELTGIINATAVLDGAVENRFLWAPLLQIISACVAPNVQLTSLDGTVNEDKLVRLAIEGIAAGSEPRAAAEEFRQLLSEKLTQNYKDVKVEFKSLEDLDTPVTLAGTSTPVARYAISLSLRPQVLTATQVVTAQSSPVPERTKK